MTRMCLKAIIDAEKCPRTRVSVDS
jgi:hypothetical protein